MTSARRAYLIAIWKRRLAYRTKVLDRTPLRSPKYHEAQYRVRVAQKALDRLLPRTTVRLRALAIARHLVGIMEVGGNNTGARVAAIIRENGGAGPEPWCGDFVAYCYRHAGSKVVTRSWAAVRSFLGPLVTGMHRVKPTQLIPGDLVVYNFDHIGIFVKHLKGNKIETIEGNTGAAGAVSDSRTGGDGVYIKRRDISLVKTGVRVYR